MPLTGAHQCGTVRTSHSDGVWYLQYQTPSPQHTLSERACNVYYHSSRTPDPNATPRQYLPDRDGIAHRMNGSGYVRMAYEYIAIKAHCCERTAIRQVARLVEEYGVFRKYVFRTTYGHAINLYQYCGTIPHRASPPVTTQCDTMSSILPDPEREKECAASGPGEAKKSLALRHHDRRQRGLDQNV